MQQPAELETRGPERTTLKTRRKRSTGSLKEPLWASRIEIKSPFLGPCVLTIDRATDLSSLL